MKKHIVILAVAMFAGVVAVGAQVRQPSTAARQYVVKSKQQVSDIQKTLGQKPGNTNEDIVAAEIQRCGFSGY